ncbi:MAG: winged helix-turn-helix transcriptional regulator [Thermoproteota archaeon]|nr:winged helix-turn-helix transcriptional regulator [Thermoproteota archaeon]
MRGQDSNDNINESKILDFIKESPGSHLRRIKKELGFSMGTIQYHLRKLEKEEKITSSRNGLHKCFFVTGIFGDHEKDIIKYFNQDTPRKIILFIVQLGQPTQTDIALELGITSPTISWNLNRLVSSKIIAEIKDGRYKRYTLDSSIDPLVLTKLLKSYYPSLWNKWSDKLAEIYLSLSFDAENKEKN